MRRHTRMVVPPTLCALVAALTVTLSAGAATPRSATAAPVTGGTLRVAFGGDMTSFDPAQAVSNDWYLVTGALFNGLYQDDRNGKPQLDLADGPPTVSADGKTWTFKMRKGVLFGNGMEVTADDLKFSIMRTLDPHLKPAVSWGQSTDDIFVGSHDFVLGKTKDVPGIQVLDRYTIRFKLTQPVAILPYILAETFNMVVPRAVVTKESADYFGSHAVGAGPFLLQTWTKGLQVVLVRNPHYFRPGKPYLDKIIVDINVAPNVIALKVEKGELDGFARNTDLSAADAQQAGSDPKYASYLVNGAPTFAVWLNVNVNVAPLTKLVLRQAIALAINRPRLVRLLGGLALPATQIYIPLDTQYDPTLDKSPVYAYNPQKAMALVKASGYHGQPITLYYATNFTWEASIAPGLQQDLRQIGLNLTLRGVTNTELNALVTPLKATQITIGDWGIDFPDAYDVYSGEMSCGANAAGGVNAAHYCDQTADALVTKAQGVPLGADRDALLRRAQLRILQSAAFVPLVYRKTITMVSPRVGGFYLQPIWGWTYADYWLKR